jgi:hypothetical protein
MFLKVRFILGILAFQDGKVSSISHLSRWLRRSVLRIRGGTFVTFLVFFNRIVEHDRVSDCLGLVFEILPVLGAEVFVAYLFDKGKQYLVVQTLFDSFYGFTEPHEST